LVNPLKGQTTKEKNVAFDYDSYTVTGSFVKFENVGDSVVGIIKQVREGKDFNGNPCPELILEDDDGDERTVTAGQVLLRAALAEKAPQPGDKIRITYSGVGEGKPGKAPAKLFTVEVKPGPHVMKHPEVAHSDEPF
jgi:hypothetical protein